MASLPILNETASLDDLISEGRTRNQKTIVERGLIDPDGAEKFRVLRSLVGTTRQAADMIGLAESTFIQFLNGSAPVRKTFVLAAERLIEEIKSGEFDVEQEEFVALVVVPKNQGDRLSAAVKAIGGRCNPLTFKKP